MPKLKNGVVIEELMAGRARVRLRMPFGETYAVKELTPEAIAEIASLAAKRAQLQEEGIPEPTFEQVSPKESDYIFPLFRALSADLIGGYFLDFRKEGVLKAAVPLLYGQTVFTNHRFWDVERWIGVVNVSEWDAKGEKTSGIPGINVELKIDWKMSPRIARGLLMKPPAIHSVSATVMFEWDASHPDLLEKGIFWSSLGEEIDGEIVRIVVTKILGFWELSLVFQGADVNAKQLPEDDDDVEEMSVPPRPVGVAGGLKQHDKLKLIGQKEKTTVKLTEARKQALGITHQGEDVPDEIVLVAVDSLNARATSADAIVNAERAEVLRLATVAEGDKDGKLSDVLKDLITKADASQLPGLKTLYSERAEAKFTKTCQKCGSTEIGNRSSVEAPETAKAQPASVPDTSLL